MESKSFSGIEIKSESKGEIRAVFSTLDVVDRDGDVTVKGAMQDGAQVRISAYNHKSWEGALPVGKGVIREVGNEVVLEGQFFMNTTHGRDTFETVKGLGDIAEWSYGFDVVESDDMTVDDAKAQGYPAKPGYPPPKRRLRKLAVHEVSPVLLGAGMGTRTLAMKSNGEDDEEDLDSVEISDAEYEGMLTLPLEEEQEEKATFSRSQRESLARRGHAMPDGSFPIRNGSDLRNAIRAIGRSKNPAAARRHIIRRARALGMSSLIPDTWKASFADELKEVVASIEAVRERAAEVMALRAEKGTSRPFGEESTALIEEVQTELKALEELLKTDVEPETANDELRAVYLRFVASEL